MSELRTPSWRCLLGFHRWEWFRGSREFEDIANGVFARECGKCGRCERDIDRTGDLKRGFWIWAPYYERHDRRGKVSELRTPEGFFYISITQPQYLEIVEVVNREGNNPRELIWLGDRFGGLESFHVEGETWFWKSTGRRGKLQSPLVAVEILKRIEVSLEKLVKFMERADARASGILRDDL